MAYVFVDARIMPKLSIASVVSTTAPVPVGTIVRAKDSALGEGEFIMLPTNASVVVGSLMIWRQGASTGLCTNIKTPSAANGAGAVAVAMAAGVVTPAFGWFQISGTAPIKKSAVIISANKPVFQSTTAGRVRALLSAGRQVLGMLSGADCVSTTSTVICTFNRPFLQGNAT